MSSYPSPPRTGWLLPRDCRVGDDGSPIVPVRSDDGSAYDCFAPFDTSSAEFETCGLAEKLALLDALTAEVSEQIHDQRLAELSADEVLVANRVLDRCGRRVRSAHIETVGVIDDKGLHLDDGFRTVKALQVHALRMSGATANRLTKTARALKAMPCARQAYAEGRLGADQVDLMGRLYGNTRIRDAVEECDELFTEDAAQVGYDDFAALMAEFKRLADQDGAEKKDDRNHERRDASLTQDFDGGWTLQGSFGSEQGAAIKELLDRFTDTEFQADLETAREQFGENASLNLLARTAAQRRADAFYALCLQGAATSPDAKLPVPLVSIVLNETDVESTVERHTTGASTADPARYRETRCSTNSGYQVAARAALSASLVGHIRRVVLRGDGVVIDQGRKQRLFTGSARDAALINQLRCNYATCGVPARLCQIDHLLPWSEHGQTNQDNGGPKCGYHNRWATNGYRTWRDADGHWHTYRPNGTEIL